MSDFTLDENGSDDIIDSREIQARIDELEEKQSAIDDLKAEIEEIDTDNPELTPEELVALMESKRVDLQSLEDDFTEDEREELQTLEAFKDECGISEWEHGETLINSDYWEEYVEEMLKDIGALPKDLPSWIVIDWESTADNIKQDYSEAELNGETYYFRMS